MYFSGCLPTCGLGPSRRKPTSLASFDINLLRAWYIAQDPPPRLTVFLHEFEKFDAGVMQDVFYICRQVFLLVCF